MKYGYARVSTKEQNLDRQLIELRKHVDEKHIVIDKESGKDLNRPGYQALKSTLGLRKGDILYIMSLDRLSRNKEDIRKELQWFKDQGIRLVVLDLPTTGIEISAGQEWILDMVNNILIEVLASIAQQERETIRRRQREGIYAAKAAGKKFGRPTKVIPDEWDELYAMYKKGKATRKYCLEKMKISASRFKYLARKEEKKVQ